MLRGRRKCHANKTLSLQRVIGKVLHDFRAVYFPEELGGTGPLPPLLPGIGLGRGRYPAIGLSVMSKDGKTMTTATDDTNAEGQPSNGTLIYDMQARQSSLTGTRTHLVGACVQMRFYVTGYEPPPTGR